MPLASQLAEQTFFLLQLSTCIVVEQATWRVICCCNSRRNWNCTRSE